MKKIIIVAVTVIACLCMAPVTEAATLDEVKELVALYYYGEKPATIQKARTIDEIIRQLDEYSVYMTPAEYKEYLEQYASAGTVRQVASTVPPVDNGKNVQSHMMYGNTGYLKIKTFSAHLLEDVTDHWGKLKAQGAQKLVVDLRFNGGGYVESAEQLLGFFPKVKDAYKLKTRTGIESAQAIPAKNKFPDKTYVLVNRFSASASEIVAVSVMDQKAAVVVGEKTKGKGSVQSLFELENGGALKLTTGHYTGPKGTPVHHKGVEPSVQMRPGTELTGLHKRLITDELTSKSYRQLKGPSNVSKQKVFNVRFTQPMDFGSAKSFDKMELIKFGGVSIPVTKKQVNDKTMMIHPVKLMQPDAEYMLVIHPGIQSVKGPSVKYGTFTTYKVQPAKTK
ncbi:S41 family peptidase [Sporosarcina sp.]|uniref:S41 family peptidase n=1 Tax=Sporosarcina sp. TaxID=49982 RepID=UPI002623E1FE|nr:S41 family peptidase [Sporosarcina sp.]